MCYTHITEATSSFFGIFNVDGCWLSLPVIVHLKKLNDTLFNISNYLNLKTIKSIPFPCCDYKNHCHNDENWENNSENYVHDYQDVFFFVFTTEPRC